MKSIKTKERIGIGLYALAIILLMVNIFQMGADKENRIVEISSWLMLIVASVYAIWLSLEKKRISNEKP